MSNLIPILDELAAMQSAERILHQIVEQLSKDVHCQSCAVVQINMVTEALEIRNACNLSWTFIKNYRKQIAGPVLSELIWKGQPIYIPDSSFAETFKHEIMMEREFGSAYAVQLSANNQPLGFLYIDSELVDNFKAEQQLLIRAYARLISICLFLDRVTGRLKQLEDTDADSGANRYEVFFPVLQDLMSRARRLNENVSVILLDVAKYGMLLKSHGVQVTKDMLKELVKLLKDHLRPYDHVSRFGTDELLIVLPGAEKSSGMDVAKKIHRLIRDTKFTEHQLEINACAGIANFPQDCSSLDGLLTAVKNALLIAKREDNKSQIAVVDEKYD